MPCRSRLLACATAIPEVNKTRAKTNCHQFFHIFLLLHACLVDTNSYLSQGLSVFFSAETSKREY